MSRRRNDGPTPTKSDIIVGLTGWVMLILGIILFIIGYNIGEGLLLLIGAPMAGLGGALTIQMYGDSGSDGILKH